jgi:hemerythrin superfamily protein
MDALQLLKKDHRAVETLFKEFEALGERAGKAKRKTVDKIVRELSMHASVEETTFYPAIRRKAEEAGAEGTDHDVLEALEEHHVVKWTLSELQKMQPSDERFEAKVTVLMESVRHHVKDEEQELFKEVRRLFEPQELKELGQQIEAAKELAPTRPHPRAPDKPPVNIVADVMSGVVDRGRDLVRDTIRGASAKGRRRKKDGAAGRHAGVP